MRLGLAELDDAERNEVRSLCAGLRALCKGYSNKINLAALATAQLSIIVATADSEQQACEAIKGLSEELLAQLGRVPEAMHRRSDLG